MKWQVDLHSHTLWSKDSLTEFETIIRLCQQRGVDRIAITDHNTAEGALAMQQIAPDLVIVGEEIMTTQGEILAYFVRETVPAGLTPEATIKRWADDGALTQPPRINVHRSAIMNSRLVIKTFSARKKCRLLRI